MPSLNGSILAVVLAASVAAMSLPETSAAANPGRALRDLQDYDRALTDIGYRLQVSAGDLCRQTPVLGFTIQDLSQYSRADQPLARREFGYAGAPLVLAVAGGSPAARAGLKADDAIVAIDGNRLPDTFDAESDSYRRVSLILDMLDKASSTGVLTLTVSRRGVSQTLSIVLARGCPARFQTRLSGATDALSDDKDVLVDLGAMRFAKTDDQLAATVAHELAHVILQHHARLQAIAGDKLAAIRLSEDEADRLGVYLVDRAGYATAAILTFWRRYRRAHPHAVDSTHGPVEHRMASIQREIARIAEMKAQGLSPRPSFMPPSRAAAPGVAPG